MYKPTVDEPTFLPTQNRNGGRVKKESKKSDVINIPFFLFSNFFHGFLVEKVCNFMGFQYLYQVIIFLMVQQSGFKKLLVLSNRFSRFS